MRILQLSQMHNIAAGHHVPGETASGGAQQTTAHSYSNFSSSTGDGNTGAAWSLAQILPYLSCPAPPDHSAILPCCFIGLLTTCASRLPCCHAAAALADAAADAAVQR